MGRFAAIVGAILIGSLTVWGYVMDARDGFELLPEGTKRPLRECMLNVVGCAKSGLHNAATRVDQTGTKVRQTWGKVGVGAAPASSRIREHMPSLYRKQKGKDALCGNPLPNLYVGIPWISRRLNRGIEVDHIFPRSKGGIDNIGNLQLTRSKYNRAKGDKSGAELDQALLAICPI